MNFKQFSSKYINFFFFIGLGPYHCFEKPRNPSTKNSMRRLLHYIPSMLYVLYMIVIVSDFLERKFSQQISFNYSLYSIYIFNSFVNCFIAMRCSPFVPNSLENLWCKFENLEQYCNQYMQLRWSFKQCNRIILRKYLIIGILFCFRIVFKVLSGGAASFIAILMHYSLIAFTFFTSMHAFFYVEAFQFVLKIINRNLSKSFKNAGNTKIVFKLKNTFQKQTYSDIEICKNVHYKLWIISKLINDNFGWVLVCYFMQAMSNILNLCTWFMIDIHIEETITEIQLLGE